MALVLISDRPRLFQYVPDGSGQGLIDHTTPAITPDPHAMYATDADLSGHVSAGDPHTVYPLKTTVYDKAAADQKYSDTLAAAGTAAANDAAARISAHVALADPHSQYATDTDLSTHVAGTDPHPVYSKKTDINTAGGPAAYAHGHPRMLGPYRTSNGAALASGAANRQAASVVVPDLGYPWIPIVFAKLECRALAVGTRPSAYVSVNGVQVCHGSGLDPVNQGSSGNGYWTISAVPDYGSTDWMTSPIAAGASAANRTFTLFLGADYGSANLESTAFKLALSVFALNCI